MSGHMARILVNENNNIVDVNVDDLDNVDESNVNANDGTADIV